MKNLLVYALAEVIRHRADEHTLRQGGNLRGRDERIHLRIDGGGLVVAVDRDALPLLQAVHHSSDDACGLPDEES